MAGDNSRVMGRCIPDVPATAPLVLLTVACGISEELGCVERTHSEGCPLAARYTSTTHLSRQGSFTVRETGGRRYLSESSSDGTSLPGWPRRDVSSLIRTIADPL